MASPENGCVVIVTLDADAGIIPALEAHARYGLTRFPEFAGFVSGALHRSTDGTRLVQYLRWQTETDHLACMNDPCWDEDPSARRFMGLVESGAVTMDVRVYDVLARGGPFRG